MNQAFLSALPLRAFGTLFAQETAPDFLVAAAALCGQELAGKLAADLDEFQRRGISSLEEPELNARIARYAPFEADACAREIIAWLRGEFAFDPSCLTE